jgi:hypothetical protein
MAIQQWLSFALMCAALPLSAEVTRRVAIKLKVAAASTRKSGGAVYHATAAIR